MSSIDFTSELTQAMAIDFAMNRDTGLVTESFFDQMTVGSQVPLADAKLVGKLNDEFSEHVESTDRLPDPKVQRMVEILSAYKEVEPIVGNFSHSKEKNVDGFTFLGQGQSSEGYGFTGPNGEDLVLRRTYREGKKKIAAEHIMVQGVLGQTLNTERMVAASISDGVTISHRILGRQLVEDDIRGVNIDPAHTAQLARKIAEILLLGVSVDSKPTNFFYNMEGFHIIDMLYIVLGPSRPYVALSNTASFTLQCLGAQVVDDFNQACAELLPDQADQFLRLS